MIHLVLPRQNCLSPCNGPKSSESPDFFSNIAGTWNPLKRYVAKAKEIDMCLKPGLALVPEKMIIFIHCHQSGTEILWQSPDAAAFMVYVQGLGLQDFNQFVMPFRRPWNFHLGVELGRSCNEPLTRSQNKEATPRFRTISRI